MKAYLAIKFHTDYSDKKFIEDISDAFRMAGIDVVVMVRDFEKWGEIKFTSQELMKKTFAKISESDLLVVEYSEKGVGLGIEAGYAYARNLPIYVIAKTGSEISETIKGISKSIFFYDNPSEITKKFIGMSLLSG